MLTATYVEEMETIKEKVSSIIGDGYYLKEDNKKCVLVGHSALTQAIFIRGLYTKKEIIGKDYVDHVAYDNKTDSFYAVWHNAVHDGEERIYFDY